MKNYVDFRWVFQKLIKTILHFAVQKIYPAVANINAVEECTVFILIKASFVSIFRHEAYQD